MVGAAAEVETSGTAVSCPTGLEVGSIEAILVLVFIGGSSSGSSSIVGSGRSEPRGSNSGLFCDIVDIVCCLLLIQSSYAAEKEGGREDQLCPQYHVY